jgi:uncharacterized membrane protein
MFIPTRVTKLTRGFNRRTLMRTALVLGVVILLAACSAQAGTTSSTNPAESTPGQAAVNPTAPAANTPGQAAANPTAPAAGAPTAQASFSKDVEPILQSRCVNCHGGQQTQKGLDLTGYNAVMAGSVNGPVVVAGNPDASKLIQMILQGKMPKRGPKLQPGQVQILTGWIMSGAPDN